MSVSEMTVPNCSKAARTSENLAPKGIPVANRLRGSPEEAASAIAPVRHRLFESRTATFSLTSRVMTIDPLLSVAHDPTRRVTHLEIVTGRNADCAARSIRESVKWFAWCDPRCEIPLSRGLVKSMMMSLPFYVHFFFLALRVSVGFSSRVTFFSCASNSAV
jgi:hypothetical protein